jgi:hypothetical protein
MPFTDPPIITTNQIKAQLGGVAPYVAILDAQLEGAVSAQLYLDAANAAQQRFERDLQAAFNKTRVIQRPIGSASLDDGSSYDVWEAPLDYVVGMISRQTLPRWELRRRPVISVDRMVLQFDDELQVLDIPREWFRCQQELGVVSVMPVGPAAAIAHQSGAWFLPLIDTGWPWPVIPQFVCIDYTCGYETPQTDYRLSEMRMYMAKLAAGHVLEAIQGMVPSSVSTDGFSQSFDAVGQRLQRLNTEVEQFITGYQREFRPARMVVI